MSQLAGKSVPHRAETCFPYMHAAPDANGLGNHEHKDGRTFLNIISCQNRALNDHREEKNGVRATSEPDAAHIAARNQVREGNIKEQSLRYHTSYNFTNST